MLRIEILCRELRANIEEHASAQRPQSAPASDDVRIGRALRSIEDRHEDPEFDLACLSRSMNLSPWYASRVFKRATGMNYRQALNAVRITRARQLLLNTTLSVKEVSAAVGFKHVSDLSHKFKAVYHVSPTAYRGARNSNE